MKRDRSLALPVWISGTALVAKFARIWDQYCPNSCEFSYEFLRPFGREGRSMNEQVQAEIQIANDLTALGIRSGGVLLVHASLRSLGTVVGGAETVVRGLLRALQENGTLLMPALSYRYTTVNTPVFDHQDTRSCVGALPEYFRTRANTTRSIHPTHSVSGVGALAERILENHSLDTTPCGTHSPFYRLREMSGQILFLGCGWRPNTST